MPSAIRNDGGVVTLYSATITTAGTATGGTLTNLGGAEYAAVQAAFTYGSGGSVTTAYVQTSLDSGTTWTDLACMQFGTVTARRIYTIGQLVGASTALVTPTDGALTANTMVGGVLGDRMRVKVISAGTAYAGNTRLAIHAVMKA